MAIFEFDFSGVEAMMTKLDNVDGIAKAMIEAATPVVAGALQSSLPRDTGQMAGSVTPSGVLRRNDGYFRTIRPTGVNDRGIRNMEVAAWQNYGTMFTPPRNFIQAAVASSSASAIAIMQETFNNMTGAE